MTAGDATDPTPTLAELHQLVLEGRGTVARKEIDTPTRFELIEIITAPGLGIFQRRIVDLHKGNPFYEHLDEVKVVLTPAQLAAVPVDLVRELSPEEMPDPPPPPDQMLRWMRTSGLVKLIGQHDTPTEFACWVQYRLPSQPFYEWVHRTGQTFVKTPPPPVSTAASTNVGSPPGGNGS